MRLMIGSLALAAALASVGAASAQGAYVWETVGSQDGYTLSYNPLTVSKADGVSTVTIKLEGTPPAVMPTDSQGKPVAWYVERMSINCAAQTYADLEMTGYNAAGDVTMSTKNAHGMVPNAQSPVASAMMGKVCS
jgi:hypothetical protein